MFNIINKILFPEKCKKCGRLGIAICDNCLGKIPMAELFDRKNTFAVFDYSDKVVQDSVKDLKYRRQSEAIEILIIKAIPYIEEYIGEMLHSIKEERIILVPIPEHISKENWRGFNQSVLLAKRFSKSISGSEVQNILVKKVMTLPQAKLKRNLRLKNIVNTMESSTLVDSKIPYIIIDDVTTTGATFDEARRALKKAGAKKIICIALAHGYSRK